METARPSKMIPQMYPGAFVAEHRQEVMTAIARVLDSGWYILGREVQTFEEEFARQFGFGGGVGVGNGTDALALALRSLNISPGDLVATVSHTAVATVAAIEMAGASPVFVDINSDSYTMDPESLSRTMETHGRIKAAIVVHLYGQPADLDAIIPIVRRHHVSLIEDCAQSHGAKIGKQYAGSLGDVGTFSFYPTKNLGAIGDGGMVVAGNPETLERARMLREYGWKDRYISEVSGINSRLDELQAAILRVKLSYLEAGNLRRKEIAAAYDEGLADTGLILPTKRAGASHVYHQYVVRHRDRDRLQARLKEKGVSTNIHYPVPVHRQPAYAGRYDFDPAGLEHTDAVANQILSLPMYPELTDTTVTAIINAMRSVT